MLDNRVETALLYWAAQWRGAVFVPLSWRASQADLDYCIEDCGASGRDRRGHAASGRARASRRARPGRARAEPDAVHVGHDRPAEGRPALAPRRLRAAALFQVVQQGYRYGDRTLGVMPLYHTMGIHSLIAMHLVGGCFVCQPRLGRRGRRSRLIEERADHARSTSPPRSSTTSSTTRASATTTSRRSRALCYAGAAMTSALVERCVEVFRPRLFVNHYGSTEIYTFSIHRDQAAKPGCAGRAVAERAAAARRERRDPLPHVLGRGVRRLLEPARRRREARSATAGTTPATSGGSTRTATSGSSAASTT